LHVVLVCFFYDVYFIIFFCKILWDSFWWIIFKVNINEMRWIIHFSQIHVKCWNELFLCLILWFNDIHLLCLASRLCELAMSIVCIDLGIKTVMSSISIFNHSAALLCHCRYFVKIKFRKFVKFLNFLLKFLENFDSWNFSKNPVT
jgi:hypothetical protein